MQGLRNLLRLQAAGDDYAEDRQQARRIRRVLRLNIDPFDMTPQAFRSLYRLNKLLVRGIIEEIRMDMPETERRSAISVEHKVRCNEKMICNKTPTFML